MAKCKALTGSAVKELSVLMCVCVRLSMHGWYSSTVIKLKRVLLSATTERSVTESVFLHNLLQQEAL